MAGRKMSATNNFLVICIFTVTLWNFTRSSRPVTNYSRNSLLTVPERLPTQTTVLDLSGNNISKLEISNFRSLPDLRVLILSRNSIQEIDLGVFQHNQFLEHLDLSHNRLRSFSGFPSKSLKHLDLAYNDFSVMPLSDEFTNTMRLDYFGISLRKLTSALNALVNLQLVTLFLGLEDVDEYRPGSLLVFNGKRVRIALPREASVRIFSDLRFNGSESLQLSKIPSGQMEDLGTFLTGLGGESTLLNLTIVDTKFTWKDLVNVFKTAGKSSINHLTILYPTITVFNAGSFKNADLSLKSLTIEYGLLDTATFDQSIVYSTFSNMNIDSLTISDSAILYVFCPETPSRFKYLSFKNNTLTDSILKDCKNLAMLQTLLLPKNRLEDLTKVSFMTTSMTSLNYMDVSQNHLYYKDSESKCSWGEQIIKLNLSSNKLTDSVFGCLPSNIQMLDLQSNQISAVPKKIIDLIALKELNLASNRLSAFPGCGHFSNLQVLNVENNLVVDKFSEFFQTCPNIRRLKGGRNPFGCHCKLRQLINLQKQESMAFVGWPDVYKCDDPSNIRGTLLKDFHISELECNVALLITVVLAVALCVIAVVAFLCVCFDVPWYVRMICRWSQVKHRIWKNKSEKISESIQYHAFVSYSEHDADWVKHELIPHLETEEGAFRICLHERNFVPGRSIVENIIDCIDKSYKSIFVLSPNFVQSEWCHYELYFAHHKLFTENADGLILILLDTIPAYIVPARYYKLKALMAKRTYLEWPKDKRKHAFFWTNLRAALQVELPNPEEIREL